MSAGLLADFKRAGSPVELARSAGLELDPWQSEALASDAGRQLWNCARQTGKTTTAVVAAVHTAAYSPDALVVIVSASQRQSSDVLRRCKALYRKLGRPLPTETDSATQLALESGGRIVSLPATESTVRGFAAVDLLIVDEAARVPDEVWDSLTPMIATSGGRIIAMSTPAGMRGWWYKLWTEGGTGWHRVKVTAADCPRITAVFLAEERARMGPWAFAQEYQATFASNAESLFPGDLVDAMFSAAVQPLAIQRRHLP